MLQGVYIAYRKDNTPYYRSSIHYNGKHVSLGSFDTEEKAHEAYEEASRIYKSKDITIDDVAKVCRSVSKMQGMMYHSSTKKKDMVLYKKCYMVSGLGSKDPIPDQNTGNANGQVSYCLQDDNSFGENTYKLSYFQEGDTLLMEFLILDKMGFLGVYPIKPEKMKINVLVTDCGDSLLLYLCTDLDAENPILVKKQIPESMGERMDAIYKWFIKQF